MYRSIVQNEFSISHASNTGECDFLTRSARTTFPLRGRETTVTTDYWVTTETMPSKSRMTRWVVSPKIAFPVGDRFRPAMKM